MEYEFDPKKNESNKRKHGIDFVEAQALWLDPNRIEIPAKTSDEPRWMVIGRIGERSWSAVITYRAEKLRLICVRHARKEEMELYESEGI